MVPFDGMPLPGRQSWRMLKLSLNPSKLNAMLRNAEASNSGIITGPGCACCVVLSHSGFAASPTGSARDPPPVRQAAAA